MNSFFVAIVQKLNHKLKQNKPTQNQLITKKARFNFTYSIVGQLSYQLGSVILAIKRVESAKVIRFQIVQTEQVQVGIRFVLFIEFVYFFHVVLDFVIVLAQHDKHQTPLFVDERNISGKAHFLQKKNKLINKTSQINPKKFVGLLALA